jgi:hypothetical protein
MENWIDIKDYEGLYQISNLGRIKSIRTNRYLKPSINDNGYYRVGLSKDNKCKHYKVHRLVAIHFIPNVPGSNLVNHINGDKGDNTVMNLEWVTHRENICHGFIDKDRSSYYRGVSKIVNKSLKNNRWRSRIQIDGKNIELGCYKTQEEAYNARVQYESTHKINNRYL